MSERLVGRSIVWLQNKRDATLERLRGPSPRREDTHEFRVGRLKHERVCVPRDDSLLEWAMQVMKYHAQRKAVLEVIGTIDLLMTEQLFDQNQSGHVGVQICVTHSLPGQIFPGCYPRV